MTETIFEYKFKNGSFLEVTKAGLTLWDSKVGRWVIDASQLVEDSTIRISDVSKEKKGKLAPHIPYYAFYPKKLKKKHAKR